MLSYVRASGLEPPCNQITLSTAYQAEEVYPYLLSLDGWIQTNDHRYPKPVRYQTALRPGTQDAFISMQEIGCCKHPFLFLLSAVWLTFY